jgi:hypothetical protein
MFSRVGKLPSMTWWRRSAWLNPRCPRCTHRVRHGRRAAGHAGPPGAGSDFAFNRVRRISFAVRDRWQRPEIAPQRLQLHIRHFLRVRHELRHRWSEHRAVGPLSLAHRSGKIRKRPAIEPARARRQIGRWRPGGIAADDSAAPEVAAMAAHAGTGHVTAELGGQPRLRR